jgi:ureidoglycolate hydrolase
VKEEKMKEIELESLKHVSLEDFAPYGRIIGRYEEIENYIYELRPEKPMGFSDVDVAVQAYWDLLPFKNTNLRFGMGFNWIKEKPWGTYIDWTECHKTTYEFFFPLGGKEVIFVLAPPGPVPDLEKTRAFLAGPDEGVLLDKGTWHFPPYSPYGIVPVVMPRYGEMAEVTGPVTEAFGKKFDTPQPLYRIGALHAMETYYYGNCFEDGKFTAHGEYTIKVV